jgi:hypothetical protein
MSSVTGGDYSDESLAAGQVVNPHISTTYIWRNFSLTLLLVDLKDFGFSVGAVF